MYDMKSRQRRGRSCRAYTRYCGVQTGGNVFGVHPRQILEARRAAHFWVKQQRGGRRPRRRGKKKRRRQRGGFNPLEFVKGVASPLYKGVSSAKKGKMPWQVDVGTGVRLLRDAFKKTNVSTAQAKKNVASYKKDYKRYKRNGGKESFKQYGLRKGFLAKPTWRMPGF